MSSAANRGSVGGNQRYRGGVSCPICGGSEDDDRGSGSRCFGYIGGDRLYAHCTREEKAGGLPQNPNSNTFAHKLKGECKCGVEHGPADPPPVRRQAKLRGPIEREYDYLDEMGVLLYQVVRYKNKDFIQRRPTGKGGWEWKLGNTRRVLYRLPELAEADPALPVFVVEGEKDVDNLRAVGLVATCNPMGQGKWSEDYNASLQGRSIFIIPDNDEPGRKHAKAVAKSLSGVAREIKLIDLAETCRRLGIGELSEKGDASDFLKMGGTAEALREAFEAIDPLPRLKVVGEEDLSGGNPAQPPRKIFISTREHEVNDDAIGGLAADGSVYCRGNMLAEVIRSEAKGRSKDIIRPAGSPRIANIGKPRIRELLAKNVQFTKLKISPQGERIELPAHPPDWCVAAVEARGIWPGVRPLNGIVETPVIRPDGSVLSAPGYDEATCLYYEPDGEFPDIPSRPGKAEAQAAASQLLELVCDFPFSSPDHKAAWLATMLTPFARFAIAGPCPLFLFDANAPAAGKSRLTDLVAILATGRNMPRTGYCDEDDEMRKRITSIALAGDRLMMLDNLAVPLGGSAIDAALTATSWRDRILGSSTMTPELPLFTIWIATGNNVVLKGDILRRIIPCRLETDEERPEERRDFTIKGDLIEHARENRGRLVVAALTILRAHAVASRPDPLTLMGSFESWSRTVRAAVYWSTGLDPLAAQSYLRESDPAEVARAALVIGWSELPESEWGLTTAEALVLLDKNPDSYAMLRAALLEMGRGGKLPSPQSIGMRLNAIKGRNVAGMALQPAGKSQGTKSWKVVRIEKKGAEGTKGTSHPYAGENRNGPKSFLSNESQEVGPRTWKQSPQSPQSPRASEGSEDSEASSKSWEGVRSKDCRSDGSPFAGRALPDRPY